MQLRLVFFQNWGIFGRKKKHLNGILAQENEVLLNDYLKKNLFEEAIDDRFVSKREDCDPTAFLEWSAAEED